MNANELKNMLKPLIRQTIKEILLEEKGVLSHIVKECAEGIKKELLLENKALVNRVYVDREEQKKNILNDITQDTREQRVQEKKQILQENKKKIIDSFMKSGNNNLKGIFEGIEPLPTKGDPNNSIKPQSPLAGFDPEDSGVDLNKFNFKGIR